MLKSLLLVRMYVRTLRLMQVRARVMMMHDDDETDAMTEVGQGRGRAPRTITERIQYHGTQQLYV